MKFLFWIIGIIILLFTFIYVSIFTSYGNKALLPHIEKQIQKQIQMPSKLLKFRLSLKDFEVQLQINPHNSVHLYGNYSLVSQKFDINYVVDLKELSTLQPILKKKLDGRGYFQGNIVGNLSNIKILGTSKFAYAKSAYRLNFLDLELTSLQIKSKNLDLATLLLMFNQKPYISAKVDCDVHFTNIKEHELNGTLKLKTHRGSFNPTLVKNLFGYSIPKENNFSLESMSNFHGDTVESKIEFLSDLFTLRSKNTKYNIYKKILTSDYDLFIPRVDKLFFIKGKKFQGDLSLRGFVNYQKDFDMSINTKIAGGEIKGKLHNTKLHLDTLSLDTLDLLARFSYPKIVKASLEAHLDYDIFTAKGKLRSKLRNGVFSENKLFKLLKKYANFNPYKERFNGNLDAKINRDNFLIDMDLFSPHISMDTKKAKLNAQTKHIDALVNVEIASNEIAIKLDGDVAKPAMQINVGNLMINKLLKKYLK